MRKRLTVRRDTRRGGNRGSREEAREEALLAPPWDPVPEDRRPKAKVEAYSRIIHYVRDAFLAWQEKHPALAGDDRHQRGLECSVLGLGGILDILDDYTIEYPKEPIPEVNPEDVSGLEPEEGSEGKDDER